MKNIINIIKYNLKSQKIALIIEAIIITLGLPLGIVFGLIFPGEFYYTPVISVALSINFIVAIVRFIKALSSEDGRMIFIAPISGWQFILAKFLEFLMIQIAVIILVCILTVISSGGISLILSVSSSILLGVSTAYIFITSFIVIISCYFNKVSMRVFMTIVAMILFGIVIGSLKGINVLALPYFYVSIGNLIMLNIMNIIIDIIAYLGLIAGSIYCFDNKLDIL